MKWFFTIISVLLVASGIVIAYKFFSLLSHEYTVQYTGHILVDKSGEVGDFIGGVIGTLFSLAGFIILILTLHDQSKATQIERFENKFFELIKFHRDNVQELKYTVFEKNDLDNAEEKLQETVFEGRKVFRAVFEQFLQCRNEIKQYINVHKETSIFHPDFLSFLQAIPEIKENAINLKLLASIDISYCITFYGLSAEGVEILERLFHKKYAVGFTTEILNYLKLKPTLSYSDIWLKWRKLTKRSIENKNLIVRHIYSSRGKKRRTLSLPEVMGETTDNFYSDFENYHNNYKRYYGGHQFRLGHYFRHLYQTVTFVDRHRGLSFNQKYSYLKILRAQLSTYEQALLFLNSISSLGRIWEFTPDYKKSGVAIIDSKRRKSKQLITKYALIKNLPGETIFGIKIKLFYPNIKYELDEI